MSTLSRDRGLFGLCESEKLTCADDKVFSVFYELKFFFLFYLKFAFVVELTKRWILSVVAETK